MKKRPRSITVITTSIQRRVHYVKRYTRRQDNRYIVELTIDVKEAQDFSKANAFEIMPKIFNPHDRVFAVEDTIIE